MKGKGEEMATVKLTLAKMINVHIRIKLQRQRFCTRAKAEIFSNIFCM